MTAPRVSKDVDVVALVVAWLKAQAAEAQSSVHVGARLPDTITGDVLQPAFAGGSQDYANALLRVDVAAFRPGAEGAARAVASLAHGWMRALDGQTVELDGVPQRVNAVRIWAPRQHRFWSQTVDRQITTYELDLPVLL